MDRILKSKKKYILPLVHFLLSFIYERRIFIFELDQDVVYSIPRNYVISDFGERIMGYFISKMFALIMIFFLWYLFFWIIENWRFRKNIHFFSFFSLVVCSVLLLSWPRSFASAIDNFITYSYAIRFWPEYWHSAYTSCIYAGMLMVVPSPVFMTVFQGIFAVFVLGYLYNRILDSPVLKGKGKFGVFLIFLMPGVFTLFSNPYRTELYALLCIFLISMTVMDIVDRKKRSVHGMAFHLLLCAFVGVWRTEGIVLGVLLFILQIIFIYQYSLKKGGVCILCMLLALGAFSLPQKLGDKKYYGKDYSFINSLPTLKNILSSSDANLSYPGAENDLEAIGAVTPVDILRFYGMEGYRRYNYANGRGDINQSLADDETGKAYMKAYYRMVIHNLPIYAKTQLSMMMIALMLSSSEYVVYDGSYPENDLGPWQLQSWETGKDDLYGTVEAIAWENTKLCVIANQWIYSVGNVISGTLRNIHFYSLLMICIPLYEIFIFIAEGFRFLKKKGNYIGLAGIALILLGQAAAIWLVMPAGALVYLHPYYYCSFVLCLVYTSCRSGKKERIEEQ